MHRRFTACILWLAISCAGIGTLHAREAVQLPLRCEAQAGRVVVRPALQLATYELASQPQQMPFSVCTAQDGNCQPVMLYSFDVACGEAVVSWTDLSAALANTQGYRAIVRNDRIYMRRVSDGGRKGIDDCMNSSPPGYEPGDSASRHLDRRASWWKCWRETRAESRAKTWVLPRGYAPVTEVGAKLVQVASARPPHVQEQVTGSLPSLPVPNLPVPSLPVPVPKVQIRPPQPQLVAEAPRPVRPPVAAGVPMPNAVAGYGNPHISSAGRGSDAPSAVAPAPVAAPPRQAADGAGRAVEPAVTGDAGQKPVVAISAQPDQSQAISAVASQIDASTSWITQLEAKLRQAAATAASWSSNPQAVGSQQVAGEVLPLGAFAVFATQIRNLTMEREFTFVLMGLALLSGVISGGIWFASRARRDEFVTVSVPPGPGYGHERRQPRNNDIVFRPQPMQLLAPPDQIMCGELCRSANTMLRQIDTNIDKLTSVAPLRRVLQREMRHLEQFLTAVVAANPAEPEEWRRMRNRLQRIVKELHRLTDIVDGAYHSLSAGFAGREPPRDRNEARELLGVNSDVDPKTLKKLVDALRACWHPDLAKDEPDRLAREERMKRINIAWDILREKREEA